MAVHFFLSTSCSLSIQPSYLSLSGCSSPLPLPPTHSLQMSVIVLLYFSCFPLSTSLHSPPTQSITVKHFSLPLSSLSSFSSSHSCHLLGHCSFAHFLLIFIFSFSTFTKLSVCLSLPLCLSHSLSLSLSLSVPLSSSLSVQSVGR